MPELPEVESVRVQLEKYLVGHKIREIEVSYQKTFQGDKEILKGRKIRSIRRFGKVLVIDLDNGYSIAIHLKMSGQLIYRGPNLKVLLPYSKKVIGGVPGRHTHVTFHLDKAGMLYFNDVRKFGWIKVVQSAKLKAQSVFIGKLGPEPLRDLTLEKFREVLFKSAKPIKLLLMDQEKIAGIGNIYANDALWLARINPKSPAKNLSSQETKLLYDSILDVLKKGINYGGASETYFVNPQGTEGKYQEHTLVYGKDRDLCSRCRKAKIKKFFLSSRGTYYCPVCQKD